MARLYETFQGPKASLQPHGHHKADNVANAPCPVSAEPLRYRSQSPSGKPHINTIQFEQLLPRHRHPTSIMVSEGNHVLTAPSHRAECAHGSCDKLQTFPMAGNGRKVAPLLCMWHSAPCASTSKGTTHHAWPGKRYLTPRSL